LQVSEKVSKAIVKDTNQSSKVYIEIVKQLRELITTNRLNSGDKIPSERELSERLNVGRSSVREALRALELLGLIETRRGEGTFLRDFRGHHLVQLLSTFILEDEKAKRDVIETKYYIEMDCLQLALKRQNADDLQALREKVEHSYAVNDDEFFYRIIEMADNHLFLRMWIILKDYFNSLMFKEEQHSKDGYLRLIKAIEAMDVAELLSAYRQLRNLSISTDKI
jgi:DNA-binding FadR family transcriptional regulator